MARLSIITITFNAEATLERTIESIENQDFKDIEYIIVDGRSTDGTMDIVHRHEAIVNKWVSEPDKGLYDAMNKGLRMATGDYVWFINAGDEIAEPSTVSRFINTDADIIYGDTVMTDMNGNVIGNRRLTPPEKLDWKSFKDGMLVSHQAFVARRSLCGEYDLNFRFSADFDWCIRIMKKSSEIENSHMTLARFLDGGITKQNIIPGLRERFRIMMHHYGLLSTVMHHIPIAFKFFAFWISKGRF